MNTLWHALSWWYLAVLLELGGQVIAVVLVAKAGLIGVEVEVEVAEVKVEVEVVVVVVVVVIW